MSQSSFYTTQNWVQSGPVLINPKNRAYAEGRASYPSSVLVSFILSLLLIGFFAAGSLFIVQALSSWSRANSLNQSGLTVTARVVNAHISTDNKGFKHYILNYTFAVGGTGAATRSNSYQEEAAVTQATFSSHPVGSAIPVRYLPSDPTVSDIPGQSGESGLNILFIGFGLGFYLIGIGLGWFVVKNWRLENRLKRHGQIVRGYWLSSQVVRAIGANGRTSLRIQYYFVTPGGDKMRAKQSFIFDPAYHESLNLNPDSALLVAYADAKHYQLL